ncbi:hypothetical protein EMIT074MI3_12586 [Bacillus licheniformis]
MLFLFPAQQLAGRVLNKLFKTEQERSETVNLFLPLHNKINS